MYNEVLAIWQTYQMEPYGTELISLPNSSNFPQKEYYWARTIYAGAREEKPDGLSKPLGSPLPPLTM